MKILASQLNTPINSVKSDFTKLQKVEGTNAHSQSPSFGIKILDDSGRLARKINWCDDGFNSAWQRFASGLTGFMTQPFFDYNNKRVDDETRKTSTARTLAKITAGTLTGVGIRTLCIVAMDGFTKNNATEEELVKRALAKGKTYPPKTTFTTKERFLLPEKAYGATFREIKKYRGAMGTFAALVVMVGTNFLIDAPLTTYLTNKIKPMFDDNKNENILKGGNE